MELDNWDLTIESWGPAGNAARPYESKKTKLDLGKINLTTWDKLNISKNKLSMAGAGVDGMNHISGVGYYSTTFSMDNNWKKGQPVFLKMDNSDDMILSVTINGQEIKNINPVTNALDIGPYVIKEKNSLKIKLATTLIKRVQVEHEIFKSGFAFPPPPENMEGLGDGPPPDMPPLPEIKSEFHYGLTGVSILY